MHSTFKVFAIVGLLGSLSGVLADPAKAWRNLVAIRETAEILAPLDATVKNITLSTAPGKTFTRRYEASYPRGHPRPSSLTFKKVDAFPKQSAFSVGDNSILINCPVHVTEHYTVTGHGVWFTSWCHDPQNVSPGGFLGITEAASTTVTFSADASLAGEISSFIDLSVGFSVQQSKSFGRSYGCNNNGNAPKAVWWQEKMGWASTQVVTEIEDCDGGTSTTANVHSDFPDPDNTGVRELIPGCGSPVSNQGPYCNFQASSLQNS